MDKSSGSRISSVSVPQSDGQPDNCIEIERKQCLLSLSSAPYCDVNEADAAALGNVEPPRELIVPEEQKDEGAVSPMKAQAAGDGAWKDGGEQIAKLAKQGHRGRKTRGRDEGTHLASNSCTCCGLKLQSTASHRPCSPVMPFHDRSMYCSAVIWPKDSGSLRAGQQTANNMQRQSAPPQIRACKACDNASRQNQTAGSAFYFPLHALLFL